MAFGTFRTELTNRIEMMFFVILILSGFCFISHIKPSISMETVSKYELSDDPIDSLLNINREIDWVKNHWDTITARLTQLYEEDQYHSMEYLSLLVMANLYQTNFLYHHPNHPYTKQMIHFFTNSSLMPLPYFLTSTLYIPHVNMGRPFDEKGIIISVNPPIDKIRDFLHITLNDK